MSFRSQYVGDRTTNAISLPLKKFFSNFEFAPLSASFFRSPRKYSFIFIKHTYRIGVARSERSLRRSRFFARLVTWIGCSLIFDLWSFGGKTLRWSARQREIDLVTDLDGKVVVPLLQQLSHILHLGHLKGIKDQTTDSKDQGSNLQPTSLELATSADSMAPAVFAHVLHDCLKVFLIILVYTRFEVEFSRILFMLEQFVRAIVSESPCVHFSDETFEWESKAAWMRMITLKPNDVTCQATTSRVIVCEIWVSACALARTLLFYFRKWFRTGTVSTLLSSHTAILHTSSLTGKWIDLFLRIHL